jgi:uncharacterized protein
MANVIITGGTGLIGKALTRLLLDKGYEVTIISRKMPETESPGIHYACWNIHQQTIDSDAIKKADFIIHLAGAGVADKRWTNKRKKEILESRIMGSKLILKALTEIPNKVKAVLCASAIGWYKHSEKGDLEPDLPSIETDSPDKGFLGETCHQWEMAIDSVTKLNKRLVKFRTGIVLSNDGGAFPKFKRPLKFGIAAILGSGRQKISWIHIEDLCRIYLEAMQNDQFSGVYNAVAPKPVDNKTFVLSLAKEIKGKFFLPIYVPSFLLKILLGEMSIEILKSNFVSASKIKATGFQFLYPGIESALTNLVGNVKVK